MIRVENLAKYYGPVHALDGLNLEVESGAVYGFLGPNGAGKTTTLRILSGLARPDQGQAWILGKPVQFHGTDLRNRIGVLPEEPAYYPWMSPWEYLRDFIAPLHGVEPKDAVKRTGELLDQVNLTNAANRRIGGFSRGMRQRLGLAQAMIHRPQVLLLDEPVSALDPAGRKEVLDLIETMRGSTTILLSTHILTDVERICDSIGIIAEGRMIIQAERQTLLDQYALPLFEIEVEGGFTDWVEEVRQLAFVEKVVTSNSTARVLVRDVEAAKKGLLPSILDKGLIVRRYEMVRPSLEDIFLRLTEGTHKED